MHGEPSAPSPQNDRNSRLTAIGLMAPAIVHDFGNLLQSVASVLNMVDRRIDAGRIAELKALTADGLRAIDRAAALSKRLMAYGRPRPSVKSRVDVNALLRDLQPLLRLAIGLGITVEFSLADGPLEIWCDPQDLENAVMNLAINARDAMARRRHLRPADVQGGARLRSSQSRQGRLCHRRRQRYRRGNGRGGRFARLRSVFLDQGGRRRLRHGPGVGSRLRGCRRRRGGHCQLSPARARRCGSICPRFSAALRPARPRIIRRAAPASRRIDAACPARH